MKKNLIYLTAILICSGMFFLYLLGVMSQRDTRAPEIIVSEEVLEVSVLDPKAALLQGATARDNKDGDVTDSLIVVSVELVDAEGAIQVTYAAFDAAGHVTQAIRQGKYTDYESPRFSLDASLAFAYGSGFDVFGIVHADDVLDGDITHRVRIASQDDTAISTVGPHEVELKVSNSLGETVSLVVPVEVYDAGTYDAALTLTDYLVYIPVNSNFDAKSYLSAYTRSGEMVALGRNMPEGYSLEMKNNVKPGVPGVYTVEYRVTQKVGVGDGMRSYTGYAKLIVVVEG